MVVSLLMLAAGTWRRHVDVFVIMLLLRILIAPVAFALVALIALGFASFLFEAQLLRASFLIFAAHPRNVFLPTLFTAATTTTARLTGDGGIVARLVAAHGVSSSAHRRALFLPVYIAARTRGASASV